jgi:hypothetical protein
MVTPVPCPKQPLPLPPLDKLPQTRLSITASTHAPLISSHGPPPPLRHVSIVPHYGPLPPTGMGVGVVPDLAGPGCIVRGGWASLPTWQWTSLTRPEPTRQAGATPLTTDVDVRAGVPCSRRHCQRRSWWRRRPPDLLLFVILLSHALSRASHSQFPDLI